MKYLHALVIFSLLVISKRYREKWREDYIELSEVGDAVEASLRRIDAMHNGGKPKIRVL